MKDENEPKVDGSKLPPAIGSGSAEIRVLPIIANMLHLPPEPSPKQ